MREALFLGDSHTGVLRKGFEARGWRVHGGILQTGRKLEGDVLAVDDGVLRFKSPRAQERYEAALASIGVASILDVEMPIISTFGFTTHRVMAGMEGYSIDPAATDKQFLSRAALEAIVVAQRTSALAFFSHLRDKQVFGVHSPQRKQPPVFKLSVAGDDLFADLLRGMGVEVVDVRPQTVDDDQRLREEFWGDTPLDLSHANERYTDVVVDEFERRLALA